MNQNLNSTTMQLLDKVDCDNITSIMTIYIFPTIFLIGFILNTLNGFVFYHMEFKNRQRNPNQMNYVFFFRSIHNILFSCSKIWSPFYNCLFCHNNLNNSWIMQFWRIVFNNYLGFLFEFNSSYLEVLATFERYFIIKPKLKEQISILKSKYFIKITMIILFLFSIIYYISFIFGYEIKKSLINNTYGYGYQLTNFGNSSLFRGFEYGHVIIRDLIPILILIVLNILILMEMRVIMRNKKKLTTGNKKTIVNAEKKNTLMVFMTNIMLMIGHIPIFFHHMHFSIFYYYSETCFVSTVRLYLYLSYSLDFFIFMLFNKNFRRKFFDLIKSKKYQQRATHNFIN